MNSSAVSPGRAGLFLLLTGQMLPLIDTSIANVALDSITQSLNASATQLELIVALYGVAFAVCLAMGSKLGDNYGRRRLFMWGVAMFGVASLLCGMANSINTLLAARVVQGAGAALIVPQILATLHVTLKGTAHARAISLYGGIGGIAFIVGQMGGGWLVSADIAGLGWRNAFFINVPICLLVLAFSPRYVPETRREAHSRIDWQGTFSLALILCCLLFPMALGPELHWPWTLQLMLAAVLPLLFAQRAGQTAARRAAAFAASPVEAHQHSLWHGHRPALFQRLVRVHVLHGADHAGRSGDGAVAVRQQLYRPRRGLLHLRAVRAETDSPLQHGTHFADWSGGADCRPAAAERDLLSPRYPHHHPGAGPVHGAYRLRAGPDRQ